MLLRWHGRGRVLSQLEDRLNAILAASVRFERNHPDIPQRYHPLHIPGYYEQYLLLPLVQRAHGHDQRLEESVMVDALAIYDQLNAQMGEVDDPKFWDAFDQVYDLTRKAKEGLGNLRIWIDESGADILLRAANNHTTRREIGSLRRRYGQSIAKRHPNGVNVQKDPWAPLNTMEIYTSRVLNALRNEKEVLLEVSAAALEREYALKDGIIYPSTLRLCFERAYTDLAQTSEPLYNGP